MITQETMLKGLDWAYSQGIEGVPGTLAVTELADRYKTKSLPLNQQIDCLIRNQILKAGTSGFLTGIGGFITLPVAIPVNLSSVLYVQLRMIAGIAYLCGYDVSDDHVKTSCYTCLCGSAVGDIFKEVGIKIGTKFTTNAIRKISGETLVKINKLVGFRLLTKFGSKGVINLWKYIPFAGGVIGAGWDATATYTIGRIAKVRFLPEEKSGSMEPKEVQEQEKSVSQNNVSPKRIDDKLAE